MYKLISTLKCFSVDEFGSFNRAADAIEHALKVGMPGEEFEVVDEDGYKVAGVITPSALPKNL